jgi:hypothetical protein
LDDSGGGSCDGETAINSVKKSENEEHEEQGGDGYNSWAGKVYKRGWFSLLRHQKVEKEGESKWGAKGRSVWWMAAGARTGGR